MASPSRLATTFRSNLLSHDIRHTPRLRRWLSPKKPAGNVSPETYGNRNGENRNSPFSIDTPNRVKVLEADFPARNQGSILGIGAYGTVYKASYKGNQVAAKLVQTRKYSNMAIKGEKRAAFLRHSNIVKVLAVQEGSSLSLIAMELCGTNLQDRLEEAELSKRERVDFLIGISRALQFCHRAGVVHADVKPKNVLIGSGGQPKLADFGCSVLIGEPWKFEGIRGTPGYIAPEVLKGHAVTPAADVYSLGILAWQMLSRKLPFCSLHVHTIIYLSAQGARPENEDLLDGLDGRYKLLYRCMWAQIPENRPTIESVIDRTQEFAQKQN